MNPLLFSFVAGVIGACGFAPIGWWPLTIAAFAALLWLVDVAPSLRSALARGYWFAAGHFMLGLNWIATAFTYQAAMPAWLGWVAVVLLSLYLAVYPAMAAGLAWRWGKYSEATVADSASRVRFVLIFAAAWIVTEWLRATMFTGFAWNPEGVALLPTAAASTARLIGTYGLSGLLMLVAGIFFLLVRRQQREALTVAGGVAALVVAAQLAFGPTPTDTGIAIRIVQPNIGQQDKWQEGFEAQSFARLAALSVPQKPGPRLLLWPEAALTKPLQDARRGIGAHLDAADVRARVARLIAPQDLLLTGGITFRSRDGYEATSATNSVFAMNKSGRILGRYDKAHLVPYGEYLPARPLLSRLGLSRLAPGDIDFDSGPGPRTLDLPLVGKAGFQLCYEIIFSGEVVDPDDRPGFLFNPSNDAWFGAWGPPQHLAQAQLRAIEEGLPVLRSTPTGVSAVIDADGTLRQHLGWHVMGRIDTLLPAPRAPTPFARAGNLLPFAFAALLMLLAVAVRLRAR